MKLGIGIPGAMQREAEGEAAQAGTSALRGIGLMCIALVLFSALDATAKYIATRSGLPVSQVTWLRFMSQFVLVVLTFGILAVPRLLYSRKWQHQVLRSFLMLGSTMFNFMALQTLRLDQTLTIGFLAPFIVALLAGPFLGEWIRWRRLIAIIVGFCGILVVIRPGYAALEIGMIFAGISMLCYAIFMLLTRYLSRFDPPEVTIFYSMLAGVLVMAPFAIAEWVSPADAFTWALLLSTGLWGGLGHYIFILAYRHAPASTLAPFIYFGLITHTALGYVIFGQLPDTWTIAGALIVIASGVYLVHREHVTAIERRKQMQSSS
ncbi:MAG: DMT family transporter [Hyphomicrobiaceae bacterium]